MSRNILNENRIVINSITGGDAINISSSNSTSTTCNLKISKQTANTTINSTDLFVLEDSSGNIRKITGENMKSELEQSTVVEPLLLSGNAISITGLSGFTANKILKVNSSGDAIEYADDTDTNFWNENNDILRPIYSTSSVLVGGTNMDVNIFKFQVDGNSYINGNLLVGTATNSNSRKVIVIGDSEFGDIYMPTNKKIISTNNSNDYLQFGNNTFTNNYTSNIFTNSISFGTTADLNLATGRAITRANDSNDRITFNANNFTFGNTGIFNNSVIVKSNISSNSGFVSFFEAIDNGTSNIDLHSPLNLTHDYNVYLPQNTDTNITNVYILSNKNVLAGTNVSISNSTTDTITINSTDTDTIYTGGTNITVSGTVINLDTTITGTITFSNTISGSINGNAQTATKIASITNSNIVQLTDTQTLTNKTLSTGTIYNGNTIAVNYGGTGLTSYAVGDILYASATGTLSKLAKGSANTFLMSNGTTPFYSAGYSFQNPISVSGTNVGLEGLSGFGINNQIISTNGSSALQYRTLTAGTNVTISNTASSITISSSENYWERDSNVSSFDIKTTNTVDTIALTVPLSTSSTFVSTSSIKSTLGLISGGGEYLKFIDYSGTKPLELKGIINASAQRTYHMAFKHDSTGTSYPLLGQDINGNLLFHWNALGDKFTFKSNGDSEFVGNISALTSSNITTQTGEFGNDHSKFNYDGSAYTWLYDPSGVNGATGFAGSYLGWHNNGSAIYLNTPAAGTSAGDYIGFASGNVPKGRMSMDGNFKITGSLTTSHTFCDERVKENIQDYTTNATELLNKLKIKSFNRKTFDNLKADENGILLPFAERFSHKTYYDIGLIAQDVLKIPALEFLVENQKGGDIEPMTIPDWNPLTAICIKSIQELNLIIQQQQIVINNLLSSSSFKEFKSK